MSAPGLPLSVHMPNFQGELSGLGLIPRPGDIFARRLYTQKDIGGWKCFRGNETGGSKGIILNLHAEKDDLGRMQKKLFRQGLSQI